MISRQTFAKRTVGVGTGRARSRAIKARSPYLEALEQRLVLLTITWKGFGNDGKWSTGANWSGGMVPGAGDDVVRDNTSPAGTVTLDSGNRSVLSINSTKDFVVASGASFTVTAGASALSGNFTVSPNATLAATGGTTTFTATGATAIDGASFVITGGATLALPAAVAYTNPGSGTRTFKASGPNSVLDLHNLQTLTQYTSVDTQISIQATSGGTVNLSGLLQVADPNTGNTSGRSTTILADGAGSLVDLSSLVQFQDVNTSNYNWSGWYYLTAQNGGVVMAGTLSTQVQLSGVSISQSSLGQIEFPGGTAGGPQIGIGRAVISAGQVVYAADSLDAAGAIGVAGGVGFDLNTSVILDDQGRLDVPPTSSMNIAGSITGSTTNTRFNALGTITLDGSGTLANPQNLEVMGRDLGEDAAGFTDNFVINNLTLANNTYVKLVDQSDNSHGPEPEALYVNSLIVPIGATLDLNGLHVYTRGSIIQGTIKNGDVTQLLDSGPIAQNFPTPGGIGLVGEVDEWTFFGRANRAMTIAVNPGGSAQPASVPPFLNYAKVTLLDSNNNNGPQQG